MIVEEQDVRNAIPEGSVGQLNQVGGLHDLHYACERGEIGQLLCNDPLENVFKVLWFEIDQVFKFSRLGKEVLDVLVQLGDFHGSL
jgi:hypothetical protein